jgi:hypothetical protein
MTILKMAMLFAGIPSLVLLTIFLVGFLIPNLTYIRSYGEETVVRNTFTTHSVVVDGKPIEGAQKVLKFIEAGTVMFLGSVIVGMGWFIEKVFWFNELAWRLIGSIRST